jgi:hypothetical protein
MATHKLTIRETPARLRGTCTGCDWNYRINTLGDNAESEHKRLLSIWTEAHITQEATR